MGIRLTENELWQELEAAHTGIHTSLRRDGRPISLPLWFVVLDHRIYIQTPTRSKKVARIRRDSRGSFLVERGQAWADLCAVMIPVDATEVPLGPEHDRVVAAFDEKYRRFRPPTESLPEATNTAYADLTVIRLDPAGPPLAWDNARIKLQAAPAR